MDAYAFKDLLASVIEQAVHDRRTAVSKGLIDKDCNIIRRPRRGEVEMLANLRCFFRDGGLETALGIAGFSLRGSEIKRRSNEPYD